MAMGKVCFTLALGTLLLLPPAATAQEVDPEELHHPAAEGLLIGATMVQGIAAMTHILHVGLSAAGREESLIPVILVDTMTAVYAPFGITGFQLHHDDGTKSSRAIGRGIGMMEGGAFSLGVAGLLGLAMAVRPPCSGLCESATGPFTAGDLIAHLVAGAVLLGAGGTSIAWARAGQKRERRTSRAAADRFVAPFAAPMKRTVVLGVVGAW